MRIPNRWTKICVTNAQKSTYDKKMGAVVFNKNSFISVGYNQSFRSVKKHHPKFRKIKESIHAEVDAILKAKKDLKGASILVIRINNDNEFRLARPCDHCMKYLRHVGIKTVYYSISQYPYIKFEKI